MKTLAEIEAKKPISVQAFEVFNGLQNGDKTKLMDELLEAQEPLLPELQERFDGTMIKHPLLVAYHASPAHENFSFLMRRKEVADAAAEKNWERFVFTHERPFRVQAFSSIVNELDDQTYWQLLGETYVDSENLHQHRYSMWRLLTAQRADRRAMMSESESSIVENLQDSIDVFRGFAFGNAHGCSWSLSRDVAVRFATRYAALSDATPTLASGRVSKSDMIAYFGRAKEFEILVDPRSVEIESYERLDGAESPERIVPEEPQEVDIDSYFAVKHLRNNSLMTLSEFRATLDQMFEWLHDIVGVHGSDVTSADIKPNDVWCPILTVEIADGFDDVDELFSLAEDACYDVSELIESYGGDSLCGSFKAIGYP